MEKVEEFVLILRNRNGDVEDFALEKRTLIEAIETAGEACKVASGWHEYAIRRLDGTLMASKGEKASELTSTLTA